MIKFQQGKSSPNKKKTVKVNPVVKQAKSSNSDKSKQKQKVKAKHQSKKGNQNIPPRQLSESEVLRQNKIKRKELQLYSIVNGKHAMC